MASPGSDRLSLRNLVFHAFHGLYPEEARLGQRFEIDVDLRLDLAPAGATDDPERTLDYTRVIALVEQVTTGQRFGLVEALAEAIATRILAEVSAVSGLVVRVRKPNPPVKAVFDGIEVEIERERVDGAGA